MASVPAHVLITIHVCSHTDLTETLCRIYFYNYPHFTDDTPGLRGISNLLKTEELIYKQQS